MSPRKIMTMKDEPCPVARGVDVVGDRWSLLIVRDAFDGMRRFGDFQRSLGVARNILSDRLRKLVDAGILATQAASDGSAYQEYVLTAKGKACSRWCWPCASGASGICSRRASTIPYWWTSRAASPCP